MLSNSITRAIADRVDDFNKSFEEYNLLQPELPLYKKNDYLEELCIKLELIVSLHLKALRSIDELAKTGDYMFRSDIADSSKELREYLKSYTSMAWNFAEILRNSRIKLEYQLELSKLDLQK